MKDSYLFHFDADSLTDKAKLKTPEGLGGFIEQCSSQLDAQNEELEQKYHIGESTWNADLVDGTITFSYGGNDVVAEVEVVGTVNTDEDTFVWACDNGSFSALPNVIEASQKTKDFLDDLHYLYMWESPLEDSRYKMLREVIMGPTAIPEALRLTAVANKLSGSLGTFAQW